MATMVETGEGLRLADAVVEAVAAGIKAKGYAVVDGALGAAHAAALRDAVQALDKETSTIAEGTSMKVDAKRRDDAVCRRRRVGSFWRSVRCLVLGGRRCLTAPPRRLAEAQRGAARGRAQGRDGRSAAAARGANAARHGRPQPVALSAVLLPSRASRGSASSRRFPPGTYLPDRHPSRSNAANANQAAAG